MDLLRAAYCSGAVNRRVKTNETLKENRKDEEVVR